MDLITRHPIHELNGNLLIPAGTKLSTAFIKELCAGNTTQYAVASFLGHGSILKDLMQQITVPPYDVIFSQERATLIVLDIMERIMLPEPILEVMDYFKEHDFHTYRHMLIISALSSLILHDIDPSSGKLYQDELTHFGPSHDIGKVTVPIEVLLKETPLTHAEHDLLQNHALAGHVLLSYYLKDNENHASLIARDHHERKDGSGYPRGINQQNIIVEVTAACDIYDALVAQRPYRKASYDNRSALEELTLMAQDGEIGWRAVQSLVAYNRREKPDQLNVEISLERRGKPPENNLYGKFAD